MKKNTKVIQSKRNILLVVVIIVVSLVVTVGITIYILHDKQKLDILRQDLQSTHASLDKIASDLGQQTQTIWNDQSECYRMTPRLFGDDYKYICEVKYDTTLKETGLNPVEQITEGTTIDGLYVKFDGPSIDLAGEYTTFIATIMPAEGSSNKTRNCSIQYIFARASGQTRGLLKCHFSLTKAQYDAVSSTLKIGEDRT